MPTDLQIFDPDRLMIEAEVELGLSDWGGEEFCEPLRQIARFAAEEARLTPTGATHLTNRVRTLLRNRLRRTADRTAYPQIGQARVERPIFITGLGRAGTTHTHALLSLDPAMRSPRLWEILDPSPPARCEELDGGSRASEVQRELEHMGFSSPEMKRIHQTDATSAEEDGFIFEQSFASRNFPAFWRLPSYLAWLDQQDQRPVYAYHRQFLQGAQTGCPGKHWVLKAPMHMFYIDALLDIYPDAIIIQNHRDPARIIPSISNFFVKLRGLFSDHVDPAEIGNFHLHNWLEGLNKMDQVRAMPGHSDHFFDIHYLDIVQRPIETMERFYDRFGLPFSDETRQRMIDYIAHREREGHGSDYSLSSFGLEPERIDELYAPYMAAHGIEREKRR